SRSWISPAAWVAAIEPENDRTPCVAASSAISSASSRAAVRALAGSAITRAAASSMASRRPASAICVTCSSLPRETGLVRARESTAARAATPAGPPSRPWTWSSPAGLRACGRRARAYWPSLPGSLQCLMTAVVPAHRCGAAPDSHRVPFCSALGRANRRTNEILHLVAVPATTTSCCVVVGSCRDEAEVAEHRPGPAGLDGEPGGQVAAGQRDGRPAALAAGAAPGGRAAHRRAQVGGGLAGPVGHAAGADGGAPVREVHPYAALQQAGGVQAGEALGAGDGQHPHPARLQVRPPAGECARGGDRAPGQERAGGLGHAGVGDVVELPGVGPD